MARHCAELLQDKRSYNLHIFINSVDLIASVLDLLERTVPNFTPDVVKVVCSTSSGNRTANQNKLGAAYPIGQPSDPVKRINFYTSTCFEGCDIYDEEGVTMIVSDGRKAHTLLDISTLFTQICGRIRDSRHKSQIMHIYSTTKYSQDVTLEEFVQAAAKSFKETKRYAEELNGLSESARTRLFPNLHLNEPYARIEDNRLIVDVNLIKLEIADFKLSRQIYRTKVQLTDELLKHDYQVTVVPYSHYTQKLANNPNTRISFQELFDEYHRLKTTQSFFVLDNFAEKRAQIERRNPLVKEAYETLGVAKVKELKYRVGNIKRELTKRSVHPLYTKIVQMINDTLPQQKAIPKAEVKKQLQTIYDTLGLQRTAKASDLAG